MHGMMFREFFLFAENATSVGFVRDMRSAINISNAGYNDDGPYEHHEMVRMMEYIAQKTGYDMSELNYDFGRYLFHRFTVLHPEMLRDQTTALDFLEGIEQHIHDQVRHLIPASDPPQLACKSRSEREMVLHYNSRRPFADLCSGLIEASLEHFGATYDVERNLVASDKSEAIFHIKAA